jgi:hypothetical protein
MLLVTLSSLCVARYFTTPACTSTVLSLIFTCGVYQVQYILVVTVESPQNKKQTSFLRVA